MLGLLASGMGSTMNGDPRALNSNLAMQAGFADLNAQRAQLKERARRQAGMARLPGLLTRMDEGAADRGEIMGLLSDVAPEAMVTGLLGEMFAKPEADRSEPADLRMMRALGIEPTPENYAKFKAIGGDAAGAHGIDGALKQLQMQKLLDEMRDRTDARAETAAEKQKKRRLAETSLNRNFGKLEDLAALNDQIKGTVVETGVPLSSWRRAGASGAASLGRIAGFDTAKLQDNITASDRLAKGLNDLVIETIDRFGDQLTNDKLALLQSASANPNITPEAISSILGAISESMLDAADIEGYNVADPDRVTTFIKRMKTPAARGAEPPMVDVPRLAGDARARAGRAVDAGAELAGEAADVAAEVVDQVATRAADIARMTVEEIEDLDIDALTAEQLEALDARLKKLGK